MKNIIILGGLLAVMAAPSAFARNLGTLSEDQQPRNLMGADEFVKFANSTDAAQPQENMNSRSTDSLWYGYGYYPYYGYWLNDQESGDHATSSRMQVRSNLDSTDTEQPQEENINPRNTDSLWYGYGYYPYYGYYWMNDQGSGDHATRSRLQVRSNVDSNTDTDLPEENLSSRNTDSLWYGYGYYPYYGYYWLNDHASANVNRSQLQNHSNVSANMDRAHVAVVCFASDAAGDYFAQVDAASNVANTQQTANRECLASGSACTQNLGCAMAARN